MKKRLSKEKFNILLKKIKQKNKRAFKILYDTYGKFIYFSALSVCASSAVADEIVNDVLFKIWQLSTAKDLSIENPEGWLYTITVNQTKNRVEKRILPVDESFIDKNSELDDILESDTFYDYIKCLSEEEQAIFIARFIQDMKFEDIAAAFDMPLSTLTTKYYRALDKIKDKMKN